MDAPVNRSARPRLDETREITHKPGQEDGGDHGPGEEHVPLWRGMQLDPTATGAQISPVRRRKAVDGLIGVDRPESDRLRQRQGCGSDDSVFAVRPESVF